MVVTEFHLAVMFSPSAVSATSTSMCYPVALVSVSDFFGHFPGRGLQGPLTVALGSRHYVRGLTVCKRLLGNTSVCKVM